MVILLCLLIFLPKILCGFALIHWFWKELDFPSLVLKFALSIPIGLALGSSLFFGALLVGLSPKIYSIVEFWGSLCIAVLISLGILRKSRNWNFARLSKPNYGSIIILFAALGLLIYAFLHYSRMHPYGFEDAWSIWNYTSRFLYRTNDPSAILHNPLYDRFHPDYPIGLSLNVAWGWFVLNRESTSLPIALAFYIIITPALMLWGALQKWRGTLPATLATLVYMMNPDLKWSVGQMADGLLALYMLSAIIMLYIYFRSSNERLLFLFGLLTGFSAWIKNEGILFTCVCIVITMIMLFKRILQRDAIKWFVMGLSIPILVVITYKLTIHVPSDLFSGNPTFAVQILDFQRWLNIGREFFLYIMQYGNWPLSIVLVLLIYIFLIGFDSSERQRQIWLLLIILAQFMGYFGVYLITPHDLDWHLFTSLDRVISHLFPMLFFWLFVALQPPELAAKLSGPLEQTGRP